MFIYTVMNNNKQTIIMSFVIYTKLPKLKIHDRHIYILVWLHLRALWRALRLRYHVENCA